MIRQFDVVANPDRTDAQHRPYLINLQSDLMGEIVSIVVAPLVTKDRMQGAQRLNPVLKVDDREFWLATHELFAVDRRTFGGKSVANLSEYRDVIVAALDLVFTGI